MYGIFSSISARPSTTVRPKNNGSAQINETAHIELNVSNVLKGRQSWLTVGWMMAEYRSNAMAVIDIVETKIEVAWRPATNLHMTTPSHWTQERNNNVEN